MRRYTLGVLAVVYMFNFLDRQILAILLPAIRLEFEANDTVLGLLAGTAFALFYVTLGIPIARIADQYNRRNLIAYAVALWSGMTVLCGMAANLWQLAAARVGVGVGEAGCSPPAHSMIADLYPPEQRATAMGVYTLGISSGIMLAYLGGGWVVENVGWREAFIYVGAPGLVLALIVRLTIPEPRRGASEDRRDSGRQPTIREVFLFLLARKSFVHMAIAAGLMTFIGYAVLTFFPSFLARSFEMRITQLGLWLGLILGISGGAGFFAGGYLSDWFSRRGAAKGMHFLAFAALLAAVCNVAVFLSPNPVICLIVFILPAFVSNLYLAPVLSQAQSLVSLRMRAVASALVLFIINVIGLALGPPLVGAVSDLLVPINDVESLRYSLLLFCVVLLPWAAWHFVLAGRTIDADLLRASAAD